MDDYNVNVLSEAKNEYSSRLVTILSPLMLEGIKSIFNDAYQLCIDNEEEEKYLMTFQNFLSRVPKWNTNIIQVETDRIISRSKCNYLEDLLTCVHITQLKILTSIRVSQKQKKIDIEIPKLQDFIHKCYTLLARKLYSNVYLYEKDVMPLTFQKNMRECELLCRESIFDTIRQGIPIESILRAYIDETVDEEIIEEDVEKIVDEDENIVLDNTKKNKEKAEEITKSEETVEISTESENKSSHTKENKSLEDKKMDASKTSQESKTNNTLNDKNDESAKNNDESNTNNIKLKTSESNNDEKILGNNDSALEINIETPPSDVEPISTSKKIMTNDGDLGRLSFNNNDSVLDMGTNESKQINAPKDIQRLEKISVERNEQRKLEEAEYGDEDDDEYEKINIMGDIELKLDSIDVHDLDTKLSLKPDPILNDVEILS